MFPSIVVRIEVKNSMKAWIEPKGAAIVAALATLAAGAFTLLMFLPPTVGHHIPSLL